MRRVYVLSVNKILIESIKTISKISQRKLIEPYGENHPQNNWYLL